MSMKQYVGKLIELLTVTDPNVFPKTPRGYAQRERASLVQLCMHVDKTVRMAAAHSPLLRDMFIVAMYESESDRDVKDVLEPRYLTALSKAEQRESEIVCLQDENESLKAQLKAVLKKKKK